MNYYLNNGQLCTLLEKRQDSTFLVDPHYYFEEYNEDQGDAMYTQKSGKLIIVDKIFKKPPLEVINAEFEKIAAEINIKKGELSLIKSEVSSLLFQKEQLKKGLTDINKWVVDLSQFRNAKTIACFLKNEPYPSIVHPHYYLIRCPQIYFTTEMTIRYEQLNKEAAEANTQRLKNEIANKQEELDKLINSLKP